MEPLVCIFFIRPVSNTPRISQFRALAVNVFIFLNLTSYVCAPAGNVFILFNMTWYVYMLLSPLLISSVNVFILCNLISYMYLLLSFLLIHSVNVFILFACSSLPSILHVFRSPIVCYNVFILFAPSSISFTCEPITQSLLRNQLK